jgi:hypothetical protein
MPEKVMSKSAYAKYRGCSRVTISRYIASGKLGAPALREDGKIDVAEADKMLAARVAPIQQASSRARFTRKAAETVSRAGLQGGMTVADAQSLLLQYRAAIKKLEYEERIGKLVNADKVRETAFDAARQTRDALLNIPDRVSALMAAESSEVKVRELLTKEIREALSELAGGE